jgi:metalloendopeptidase OMA1, mitochondrial
MTTLLTRRFNTFRLSKTFVYFLQRNVNTSNNQLKSAIANRSSTSQGDNIKNSVEIPAYFWIFFGGCTTTLGVAYYSYLDVVPITGRKRWIVTSSSWESKLGDEEYRNLLEQYRSNILPPSHRATSTVHRVGQCMASASIEFAERNKFSTNEATAKNIYQPYTYTIIRSDMANAFVLPGNHVFVFTGLFRYIENEDELAIILGHEMAHNLARHMGEKLSGSFVLSLLARLSLIIDQSGVIMSLLLPTLSLLRELPNSRTLEIEADHIGILLAADACFDPRAAKRVFAALKSGESGKSQPPEFLSTHPSHDTRMEKFDDWTPKAMERYTIDRCGEIREQMRRARQLAAIKAAALKT